METEAALLRLRVWDAEVALRRSQEENRWLTSQLDAAASLRAEVDHLRRRLDLVHNSTSWNITGPLRSVARLSKKFLRKIRVAVSRIPVRSPQAPISNSETQLHLRRDLRIVPDIERSIIEQIGMNQVEYSATVQGV